MAAQPQERVRKRLAWLSPYLLAVALFPALLGFQYTCNRGDTYLLQLEFEVQGQDQIVGFNPNIRSYHVSTTEPTAILRVASRDPGSDVTYQWLVDGTSVESGVLGVGGGQVSLVLPLALSVLRVNVRSPEGTVGYYAVDVDAPSWGTPVLIETNPGDAGGPPREHTSDGIGVTVDPDGNVTAVWTQDDGTEDFDIWSNRHVPGLGWGIALAIEANTFDAVEPQVTVDLSGNATAVWTQKAASGARSIWSNRYTPTAGWGTAVLIGTVASAFTNPQVAVDLDGRVTAVWARFDDIASNRYTPTAGWGAAVPVGTNPEYAYDPQVAVDLNGNATAVWSQSDGTYNIWSNQYTPGVGWGTAVLVETNPGDALEPHIAVDPNGNVTAIWMQFDGNQKLDLWSNRYTPTAGWGTAALVETLEGTAWRSQVAVAANGNATAVWTQVDVDGFPWLASSHYNPSGGWGTAAVIDAGHQPQVAVDPDGNVTAVWMQNNTHIDILCSRYAAGFGWSAAVPVENNAGDATYPHVAVDPGGTMTAVWQQDDGTGVRNIWSSRYE